MAELPWPTRFLGDVGEWLSGGTPSKDNSNLWAGSIPWISPKDMKVARIADAIDHVSQDAVGNGTRLVPAKTLLMVVRGMILAHTFPVAITTRPVAFNQDVKALRPTADFEPEFLLYWLQSAAPDVLRHVDVANHGTRRLPTESLFGLVVPVPRLAEQRKIAAILSSVDEVIEKTEAVIEQLQVVKTAIMQELLTRGLPGRHTRFKQTEVGEVPDEWEVVPFQDLVTIGPQNGLYKPSEHYGSGTPMLDMGDLFRSEIIEERERRRLRLTDKERSKFVVSPGDLLFARRSLVAEGSGKCALVLAISEHPVFESSIIRMRPDASRCDPLFLLHYWNGPVGQRLRMGITRQVAVSGITGKDLAVQPVIVPPIDEQRRISRVIESVDTRVAEEAKAREALQASKRALMSTLLNGEIRVTVDEPAA